MCGKGKWKLMATPDMVTITTTTKNGWHYVHVCSSLTVEEITAALHRKYFRMLSSSYEVTHSPMIGFSSPKGCITYPLTHKHYWFRARLK
jgi:hypothetical protein